MIRSSWFGLWVRSGLAVLAFLIASPVLPSAERASTTYESLRGARPDGRTVSVENLVLERDVFELTFASGRFHLLEEVDGVTPGAVFLGQGSYVLEPQSAGELRHLTVLSGEQRISGFTDEFSTAVLLFDDGTEAEIVGAGGLETGGVDSRAVEAITARLEREKGRMATDYALRLLRSRLNDEGLVEGPFFALIEGKEHEQAVVAVDSMGILDGEGSCLIDESGDYPQHWYSDRLIGADRRTPRHALVDAAHYRIDTQVAASTEISGETRIQFRVIVPQLSVLPLDLFPTLEIRGVAVKGQAGPGAFLQPSEDGRTAAVLFPEPLAQGSSVEVKVEFGGSGILEDDGTSIYRVKGRTNWYPNVGTFTDRASYDLRFRVPKGNTVISVGEQVSSKEEGGEVVSIWKSEDEITVAGFNYGDFALHEQTEENTGVAIEVYATKGEPDFITEINRQLEGASGGLSFRDQLEVAGNDAYSGYVNTYSGPSSIGVSTDALAEAAMADGVNSIQVFTKFFGPLDNKRVAITQQSDWNFGQSWPSLVYLPYLPGLSSLLKFELGMPGYAGFADQVGIHEIAHQWWGHHVGWASYRDQWLSEGFAEFSTALVVELTRGAQAYDSFWEQRRRQVLATVQGTDLPPYAAGPVTLGYRAASERSPAAGQALIYAKGAFVLQMLRSLMRDQESRSDERFFAMMRDFADSYKGKSPSTEDFKTHVEKHMIPELNAGRDGTIDWFFDQWVYGTEVPVYSSDVSIEKVGKGKYRLSGTLTQSGVSDDFVALVPTHVEFGDGNYGQFGRAPFKGNMTHKLDVTLELPKKPKAVRMNARHEVLAFAE